MKHDQTLEIGYAIEELGKALSQPEKREDYYVINPVIQAQRYLDSFLNSTKNKNIEWSDESADLSSSLHTYLRKFGHTTLETVLYNNIDRKNYFIWWRFITNLTLCRDIKKAIKKTEGDFKNMDYADSNDYLMLHLISSWVKDGFEAAYKEVLKWK